MWTTCALRRIAERRVHIMKRWSKDGLLATKSLEQNHLILVYVFILQDKEFSYSNGLRVQFPPKAHVKMPVLLDIQVCNQPKMPESFVGVGH